MSVIKCPHCFTVSDHGVNICKGCRAEVRYGFGKRSVIVSFILSYFAATNTIHLLASFLPWITIDKSNGFIVIGVFLVVYFSIMLFICNKLFKNSIRFIRFTRI
ncbi:hypothetical protein [Thorsellia kenyensis]|uniref:Uncharacterized protein n=1 Tax=Thorsellia kenyensis TaxID=1549888 RepID=A0ABV6C745_9GAMM